MSPEASTIGGDQSVEELRRELAEAREQQAATAQILAAISSAPTDPHRVFAEIAASAARLCDGYSTGIFQLNGDHLRLVAHHGPITAVGPVGQGTLPLIRGLPPARAVLECQLLHVADLQAETSEYPEGSDYARRLGFHAALAVPLMSAGKAIGVITIRRTDARPFTDRQIDLLKSFADQAVIAIENTRLFEAEQVRTRELSEALEQQTATSEVLRVISSSPTDTQPVFSAIATNAVRLCNAMFGAVFSFDGKLVHFVGGHQVTEDALRLWRDEYPISPRGLIRLAITDRAVVNVGDMFEDPRVANIEVARKLGNRSQLVVPMLQGGEVIGTINVYGAEPIPFSDAQVVLLQTFADQAVIAIENTRLFEEVQEKNHALTEAHAQVSGALERETATSEILRVIGSSPTDVHPVFETIARSGVSVCGALGCVVLVVDGGMIRLAATHGVRPERVERFRHEYPLPLSAEIDTAQTIRSRRMFHLADIENNPNATFTDIENARLAGYRTRLMVPMVRGDRTLGLIAVTREDPAPFPDQLVELLRTFADQAVIAIENTRLFEAEQASKRELQESLEYQTATSDVLGVIATSSTNIQPVLQTLVESACGLCGAYDGLILLREGDWLQVKAHHGPIPANLAKRKITRDWVNGRCVADGVQIHLRDLQAETTEYPEGAALAQRLGARTILSTPLMREGKAIGAIMIRRDEVRPFSDKQIGIIETFADQALIAIENTRLFNETKESLERQTATAEILEVIASSPSDAQPVFDAVAERAMSLLNAWSVIVTGFDGEMLHFGAARGALPDTEQFLRQYYPARPSLELNHGRCVLERIAINCPDAQADPRPEMQHRARKRGFRASLSVPMMRDAQPVGAISVSRKEAGAFAANEVALLQTFADQAVIAIENTRLFEEVQARTRELTESLEQQTATADVLKVISRSALDVKKVLDALVEFASRLCNAYDAAIFQVFGDGLRLVAHHGQIATAGPVGRLTIPVERGSLVAHAVIDRRTIQVADMMAEGHEYPEGRKRALQTGHRTALAVPLIHAGEAIGVILMRRGEVRPFVERQVELLKTFADQAVIAIENTRLFEEVQARTRELAKTVDDLEIASQHKSQFVANMSHELRTPLAAILGYAELMQEGFYEPLGKKSTDALTRIRSNGKHLLGLINTVLDIAKIESGQFSLNLGEYAIESVVETVRGATESLAETKKLALKTDVAKKLPVGLGDEQRLTQVLLNLVGNAIKFTDTGEVRITATAMDGHFTVAVTDTGPGIAQEHQARVFEQFHQVDNSNTKAKGGTGLGLAIAKQIVEMHGGRIWVELTMGQGSTFRMELPVRAATVAGAA